jgi:histidyl-tRNA synthetase
VIKVNNRTLLDGVLDSVGLGDNAGKRLAVLRAIDKLDRLGLEGVSALLGKGRKDESGDYTKGAELTAEQAAPILKLIQSEQLGATDFASASTGIGGEGLKEVAEIGALVEQAGYDDRIKVDLSVVRGLEYYTGPVFEAELVAPIKDERGQPIRLGSVVSGGRYDGLVERFTGEKVPATGISIGVSRLLFGLQRLGKYKESAVRGPVVVLVLDRDRIADYQEMAQQLRAAGVRAEMYLGDSGMKAQMKYADRRGSPCVVIQGGDEKAKGEVQIKDLILGATLTSIENREDYLKRQAEAQFAVPEAQLVEKVGEVLSRHKT